MSEGDARSARAERMRQWEAWLARHDEAPLMPELPLVDPHHHLWDRGGHTYLPAQLRADARGHRVEASVYVECLASYRRDGPEALRCVGETEAVMALRAGEAAACEAPAAGADAAPVAGEAATAATDVAAGIVGHADLSLGGAVAPVLDAHQQAGGACFKGVRWVTAWDPSPDVHGAYPTRPAMLREPAAAAAARELARRGLSLDLWLYFHQLEDVATLAAACPDQVIVLDHFGGPIGAGPWAGQREAVFRHWAASMRALAVHPGVHVKLGGLAMPVAGFGWRERPAPPDSATLAEAWRPYVDVCLEAFGPRRCMFESNFPVDRSGCSYRVLWNAFKRLAEPLSPAERAALCSGTARRVYRLGDAAVPAPVPPSD